jgi:hypothetical protein
LRLYIYRIFSFWFGRGLPFRLQRFAGAARRFLFAFFY